VTSRSATSHDVVRELIVSLVAPLVAPFYLFSTLWGVAPLAV
jgi:hypothetical protein